MIPCVIELTIKISYVNALLKEVMVEFDTTQQIKFQDAKTNFNLDCRTVWIDQNGQNEIIAFLACLFDANQHLI